MLRLVLRANRRTRATALGVAFAVLLLTAGFALLDGMRAGVNDLADRIEPAPVLFLAGDVPTESEIDASVLAAAPGEFLSLHVVSGALALGSDAWPATIAYVERSDRVPLWSVPAGEVLLGPSLRSRLERWTPIDVGTDLAVSSAQAAVTLTVAGAYPPARPFPDDWAVVSREDMRTLRPSLDASVSGVVVEPDNPGAIDALRAAGLTEFETVAAPGFLRAGTAEVLASLVPLVATVGVLVALLVYNAMSVEVAQRAREIRLLRQIGAGPGRVGTVYLGQALVLAIYGGLLGLAGGIVAAHGIVSFASLVGLANVVAPSVSPGLAALALGVSVAAGVIGGLVPAMRTGRLARPSREVVPSS